MNDWQPIETAPRDGTVILIIFEGADIPVVAWWEEDGGSYLDGEPPSSWWWDGGMSGRCEDGSTPLLWLSVKWPPF